jgi:hypothetical protein
MKMQAYAQGYQEALAEVLNVWMDNGAEAAMDYIKANLRQDVGPNEKAQLPVPPAAPVTPADFDRMATEVVTGIRAMQNDGVLPEELTEFSELHSHIDANVGWSEEIDDLEVEQWAEVQQRVDAQLKAVDRPYPHPIAGGRWTPTPQH